MQKLARLPVQCAIIAALTVACQHRSNENSEAAAVRTLADFLNQRIEQGFYAETFWNCDGGTRVTLQELGVTRSQRPGDHAFLIVDNGRPLRLPMINSRLYTDGRNRVDTARPPENLLRVQLDGREALTCSITAPPEGLYPSH